MASTPSLQIAATGTVTHVDPDDGTVYAFGHPLFNLGPIEYPMTRSEVHLVLPSLMNSFKMASSGDIIGTWGSWGSAVDASGVRRRR